MSILRRIAVALVAVALALPAAAVAQTPTQSQQLPQQPGSSSPPVELDDGGEGTGNGGSSGERGTLPDTGTDPRLLFLTGLAVTLLGTGLRLRTADADVY